MEKTDTLAQEQTLPLWRRLISSSLLSERAITISTMVVASGFLLSKVLGFVRQVLVARAFGTSAQYDAFTAANTFSDMLDSVIAGATISAVLIPVLSSFLVQDKAAQRDGWKFASAVINDMFLVMTLLCVAGMIFAPQLIATMIAPGFDEAQRALATDLMRIVLLAAIVFGVSGTVTGILHTQNRFVLAALASPLHNIGLILALLVLVPRMGIYGYAWGVVFGSLLYLGIQIPGLIRTGMRWSATIGAGQGGMGELLRMLGPRVVTTNLIHLSRLVMTNLASYLGEGSLGALQYAYQLWQFPETLIGTAIAIAVFPRLARHVSAGEMPRFRQVYRVALVTILALAIPAALVAFLFPQTIVAVLLQRGAFDENSTALVARVLQWYALAIVGESALELVARVFYAEHDAKTPMFVAMGAMLLRVALMFWWRDVWGAAGLALAYAVGVSVEAGALWWLARRRFMIADL